MRPWEKWTSDYRIFLGEREEEGTEKPKKVFVFFPLGKSVPLVSFTHWGENLTFVQKSTFVKVALDKLNYSGKLIISVKFSFPQNMWNLVFGRIGGIQISTKFVKFNFYIFDKLCGIHLPYNEWKSDFHGFHRIWVIQCSTISTDSMEIRLPHIPQNPEIIFHIFHKFCGIQLS